MQQKATQAPSLPPPEDTTQPLEAVNSAEGFAHLIAQHRDAAILLASRYLGQTPEAEDAVQEATLNAWEARGSFRGGGSFWAWFALIVRNEAINSWRRAARLRKYQAGEMGEEQSVLSVIPDADPTPELLALEHETQEHLLAVVRALPDPYRKVVLLRYWHALTYEEVASRLGVGIGTVKMRLFRAHALLRARLAGDQNPTLSK